MLQEIRHGHAPFHDVIEELRLLERRHLVRLQVGAVGLHGEVGKLRGRVTPLPPVRQFGCMCGQLVLRLFAGEVSPDLLPARHVQHSDIRQWFCSSCQLFSMQSTRDAVGRQPVGSLPSCCLAHSRLRLALLERSALAGVASAAAFRPYNCLRSPNLRVQVWLVQERVEAKPQLELRLPKYVVNCTGVWQCDVGHSAPDITV
mmetsp:Transcript_6441/g.18572  ORF Transcript_6441/g.18572 Transcript_6441/m.18572 type:complete len:202 (-) Transcript_6441:1977-2582(-)